MRGVFQRTLICRPYKIVLFLESFLCALCASVVNPCASVVNLKRLPRKLRNREAQRV